MPRGGDFHGRPFIALVDGAIDSATGQVLEGQYRSYAPDGQPHLLASPITDLLARLADQGRMADDVIADILGLSANPTEAEIEARDSLLTAIFDPAQAI